MALVKNTATNSGKAVKTADAVRVENGKVIVRITKTASGKVRGVGLTKEQHADLLGQEFRADLAAAIAKGGDGEFVKRTENGYSVRVEGVAVPVSMTEAGWAEYFGLADQIMACEVA